MADARALLRAKRQDLDAHINHPYASYSATGQLRCSACGVPVKSAAMWEGHVGSKAHRVAVRNKKALEGAEREKELKRKGKRKAEEEAVHDMEVDIQENGASAKKRRTSVEPNGARSTPPLRKAESKGMLPADFFSDPSQAPVLSTPDEEDEESEAAPSTQTPSVLDKPKSRIDLEWEQFQASLLAPPSTEEEHEDERRTTYERATIAADPELVTNADGFPEGIAGGTNNVEVEEKTEETEEEKRLRKEREERELIMDRLIEEERAQEEADERVGLLKERVEALKKAREARRKAK